MRPYQVCGSILLILLPITSFLLLGFTSDSTEFVEGPIVGSWRIPKTRHGILFDLAEANEHGGLSGSSAQDNFQIEGFKFHGTLPIELKKITKHFRPRNAWLLHGGNSVGTIMLQEVQREQPQLQSVLVVVTYFTNWNWAGKSGITVFGRSFDRETTDVEEESEMLPETSIEKSAGSEYCQKIIYFGPVDEVKIIGITQSSDDAVILIKNIKVVVGPSSFDQEQEFFCDK